MVIHGRALVWFAAAFSFLICVPVESVSGGDESGPCSPPSITTHPASQMVCETSLVTFAVSAAGTPPLLFQWRKDELEIPGATRSSYTIDSVQPGDEGLYDVVVNNSCGPWF